MTTPGARINRRQLEHRPGEVIAARERRAVEIAGGIEDQTGVGKSPVRAVAEVMQHFLRPASARCGRQLEHRPGDSNRRQRGSCRRDCRRHRRSGRREGLAPSVPLPKLCSTFSVQPPPAVGRSTRTPSRSDAVIAAMRASCRRDCRRHRRSDRPGDWPRPCRCRSYAAPSPSSLRPLSGDQLEHRPAQTVSRRQRASCRRDCRRHRRSDRPWGLAPSVPLPKLCSTFSVQPPPAVGVNSNTVPEPYAVIAAMRASCRRDCRRHRRSGRPWGLAPSVPLPKLCSTFSVQPPPAVGDNSNTVPSASKRRQ